MIQIKKITWSNRWTHRGIDIPIEDNIYTIGHIFKLASADTPFRDDETILISISYCQGDFSDKHDYIKIFARWEGYGDQCTAVSFLCFGTTCEGKPRDLVKEVLYRNKKELSVLVRKAVLEIIEHQNRPLIKDNYQSKTNTLNIDIDTNI